MNGQLGMTSEKRLFWDQEHSEWDGDFFNSPAFPRKEVSEFPEQFLFTRGFHFPLFRLCHALKPFLTGENDQLDSLEEIGFDSEDIYISTLWFGWQLLGMGFTSVVLILEDGMVIPGGLDSAAQALKELGLSGQVGNAVNLQSRSRNTLLALQENRYFITEQPFPGISGIHFLIWGNQYPILAEFKYEEIWFNNTLYLFGITSHRDTHDLFRIVPPPPTIVGDPGTVSRLKEAGCARLLISLQSEKQENPPSEEAVLREYPFPKPPHRLLDLFDALSFAGEQDYFWKEQSYLHQNFHRIYPAASTQDHGFLFLSYPEELLPPRQTFHSVHTFDHVLINNRWVIKDRQLVPVKQKIVDHEFKHILRKIKRQM